jgi:hypothetical protein
MKNSNNFNYNPKPEKKLIADCLRRSKKEKSDFVDFEDFKQWYNPKRKSAIIVV